MLRFFMWTSRLLVTVALAVLGSALPQAARAQDALQFVDLNSDAFTKADMTRAEVEAVITAAGANGGADFSGKRLNRLDLSGLDLHGANLKGAMLNNAKLTGANLSGANLDRVWGHAADFSGANLEGASVVSAELMDANFDKANFAKSELYSDFSRASVKGATLDAINVRGGTPMPASRRRHLVFRSAKLDGASFKDAGLIGAVFEFASLRDADLSGAILAGGLLAGADLRGAKVAKADFNGADLESAHLEQLVGRDAMVNLDRARNVQQAYTK